MKRVIFLENSLSLSETVIEQFKQKQVEVICYSEAIVGIKEIHQSPPDLIIISSLLKDLRGADVLEYLKDNNELKTIPIIMFSTVTNPMNDIYFKEADVFIKRDVNFIDKLLIQGMKLLSHQNLDLPQSKKVSSIVILSGIDRIYNKRDVLNKIILDLLDQAFVFSSLEKTINNCIDFIGKTFSVSSITYTSSIDEKKIYKQKFKTPENVELEIMSQKSKYNTSIELVHFIDNNEEKQNLLFTLKTVFTAFNHNAIYNDNKDMSNRLNFLFKKFLPDNVVDDLLNRKSQKSLMTGEKREIAVIFSHIKNFNHIEDSLSAEGVVNFLNNHFSGLSTKIKEHGGEINKFIGDAVFAMVGAPLSFNNNQERAIKAALDMVGFVKNSGLDYKIGIGIHVGKAIIGNIGSQDNFDYTAIGDTINLAARLESLCKYYDVNILVSDIVHDAYIKQDSLVEFRQIDTVMVQGKDEPTTIYSVERLSDYPKGYINRYNKGIKMFVLGNWNFAFDYFIECQKELPDDKIITIYLERCKQFIHTAPINWTGAITLDFK